MIYPNLNVNISEDDNFAFWSTHEYFVKVWGYEVKIPAEFTSDFASIPWMLRRVSRTWGRFSKAAFVHDYLYYSQIYDKQTSDKIFLVMMENLKVAKWKRLAFYNAVKFGGWVGWNKRKKELNNTK